MNLTDQRPPEARPVSHEDLLAWLIRKDHGDRLVIDDAMREESQRLCLVSVVGGDGDEVISVARKDMGS